MHEKYPEVGIDSTLAIHDLYTRYIIAVIRYPTLPNPAFLGGRATNRTAATRAYPFSTATLTSQTSVINYRPGSGRATAAGFSR